MEQISRYYLKNGNVELPKTEVTFTDDQNRLIAVIRKFRQGIDTEITEGEYQTYLLARQQMDEDIEEQYSIDHDALMAYRSVLETSILTKLTSAVALTQEEAEYLVQGKVTIP